jgi:hypothetical protein
MWELDVLSVSSPVDDKVIGLSLTGGILPGAPRTT